MNARATQLKKIEADEPALVDHDRYLPFLFSTIATALSIGSADFYMRTFGIGVTEWRVLSVLAAEPALGASVVGRRANLDKAAVSRSLKLLEDRGYVATTDDLSDARRRLSGLTVAGQALYGRVLTAARSREENLVEGLSSQEVETLIRLLQHVRRRVSRDGSSPMSQEKTA